MKSLGHRLTDEPAILRLAEALDGEPPDAGARRPGETARHEALWRDQEALLDRARAFAVPLLESETFDTGESALRHAEGVARILEGIGAAPGLRAAAYLVYASAFLQRPEETIAKAFGPGHGSLVAQTRKLVALQGHARGALQGVVPDAAERAAQLERVRKMLLAFSRDLRVVLLRLASRLQTLRHHAETRQTCPRLLAEEALQVFAPLANRLGIWPVKWELEDLAFRALQPEAYRQLAQQLDATRIERERFIEQARQRLVADLEAAGLRAEVQGRPKHLYSIWKKMQGKRLPLERIFDLQALRVVVPDIADCYAALSRAHSLWTPLADEFDDYIVRPKPNGYQSLHTVVLDEGRPIEVQIRTSAMHDHAESGVAAHWAYKEAGARGYGGVVADETLQEQLAAARKAVLQQLLAWERDLALPEAGAPGLFEDRIYLFTPQATIVELGAGGTPVDFAYGVHTELGHRCRGARVDGQMVPLNTPLRSGQTVEILSAKEGGPSLDWLNPDLGYLRSPRSRAKVRAWFNAQAQGQTIARGRETVEKLLQREGRTAVKLDELAAQLGFAGADALFEAVGKDEMALRPIEQALRPSAPPPDADTLLAERLARPASREAAGQGGVLVVGVASLMTQLARCCKPAPPDAIVGYVTRGQGVAIHRAGCRHHAHLAQRHPERVLPVAWGEADAAANYPLDVLVQAQDRPGLLRDLAEVFAKDKIHIAGMRTESQRGLASLRFTVEVAGSDRLARTLAQVQQVPGVLMARRG